MPFHPVIGSNRQSMRPLMGVENYSSWAFQMRSYLEMEELWDVVQPPEAAPGQPDAAKVRKARARIILAIHESLHPQIQSLAGAKAIWDAM